MVQPPQGPSGQGWQNPAALDIAFKEYQLLMEGTDKITDRRQTVNTLFVSINALFLTGVGYLLLQSIKDVTDSPWYIAGFIVIAILMSTINSTWLKLSESNRRLVDLRIRYMKQLEKHLRENGHFPPVVTPLKKDEARVEGVNTLESRGTYTIEDVLYNPDAAKVAFGFSRAEQRIGRTFTTSYWLALLISVAAYAIAVVPGLLYQFGVLPRP